MTDEPVLEGDDVGRPATLAEASALLQDLPLAHADDALGMMADIWPIRIADGPLHRPSLQLGSILVVRGDLAIDRLVADIPSDHGAMLVVLGKLSCADLVFHGPMFVTGDLIVERTAFFSSSGDWGLVVGGAMRGEVLVEYDHAIEVRGGLAMTHVYRRGQSPHPLFDDAYVFSQKRTRRIDGKHVEVVEYYIDPGPMEDAICAGRSVLRAR